MFSIEKPYLNLDTVRLYRRLGTISVTGIELSVAGALASGVSVVAGTVLLDPVITGEPVENGQIGSRPVGQLRRRSILNLDWRPAAGTSAWSFDFAVESSSARTANAANTLSAPAYISMDLGSRYRFSIRGVDLLARFKIENLANQYGWLVSSSGGFTYANGRTATLQLVADF